MNKLLLGIFSLLSFTFVNAQNVGINQATPTNSLHITPINIGDNPIRIDGLQSYNIGDTSLLIINNATGIVKYITSSDLVTLISNGNGLGTDDQNVDSLTLNNNILTTYLEDGGSSSVDLSVIGDSTISYLVNNSDTLLNNSNFINNLRDSIDTDVDSIILNGTVLHVYENGNDLFANLNNLQDGTGTDNQTLSLTNNTLSINGGNSVDLSQYVTPSGAIFAFPTSTPPTGYLACNGQAISRTTYSNLFTLIGTSYGAGNGTTTFNLPNYNGQFLRGWDNGQGTDLDATNRTDRGDGTTGDIVGTKQSNQTLAHSHTVNPPPTTSNTTGNHSHTINPPSTSTNTTGAHNHSIDPPNTSTTSNGNHTHTMPGYHLSGGGNQIPWYNWSNSNMANNTNTTSASGNHSHTVNIPAFNSSNSGNHSHTIDITQFNSGTNGNHSHTTDITQFNSGNNGGLETRPTNVSVLWCIKF